jgi:hypothetical protein
MHILVVENERSRVSSSADLKRLTIQLMSSTTAPAG